MIILNFSSKGGMPQPVGVQSRDQTVIIVPNSGKFVFVYFVIQSTFTE